MPRFDRLLGALRPTHADMPEVVYRHVRPRRRPVSRSRFEVFYERESAPGWLERISMQAHPGEAPCVRHETITRRRTSTILIRRHEASIVLAACMFTLDTTGSEGSRESGSITLPDGARYVVASRRLRGRPPEVAFTLVSATGEVFGKPRRIFGEALTALARACAVCIGTGPGHVALMKKDDTP